METREETEARETKLVDDTKTFLQGLVKKINITLVNIPFDCRSRHANIIKSGILRQLARRY